MKAGISQREFAKLDGCSPKTVRDYIKTGALKTFDDGSLDPTLVGTPWRKGNWPTQDDEFEIDGSEIPERVIGSLDDVSSASGKKAARMMMDDDFVMLETHEAERRKQNYLYLRQELEYYKDSGKVIYFDQVIEEAAKQLQGFRTVMLTLPSKLAPKVIACKTSEEARLLIEDRIIKALNEVTFDKEVQ